MKSHTQAIQTVLIFFSVCLLVGCPNTSRTSSPSSIEAEQTNDNSAPIVQAQLHDKRQILNVSRLENDLRPEWMRQVHAIPDETIASAEQMLLALGVDRKYNIHGSFIGGINKLDLEILPNAAETEPLGVQIYFHPSPKILGGSAHVTEWLDSDDRLLKTENTLGKNNAE